MAIVKNDWVGYLDRSYQQIKTSLLSRVTASNPELTDHSESNPFVILLSMFAGVAEMLGYYIDNIAEEGHMATARRRSSVIKHSKVLDYRIRARNPEQVDLIITWNAPIAAGFTISAGMFIDSADNIRFVSLEDVVVPIGATATTVPISQITQVTNSNYFTTNGVGRQKVSLGTTYAHKSLQLTIDGEEYTEVDTFAHSLSTDKHYIVDIDTDGLAYIILGDGIKGILPTSALTGAVIYRTTLGPAGKVGVGKFETSSLTFNGSLPVGVTVSSTNTLFASSGGAEYEATEEIRTNAVQSIRTLDRAVTRQDHKDILEAVAGVAKAEVHFCCGKTVDLYIVPDGGGTASSGLITASQTEIDGKKMVATFPKVYAAGETKLVIWATVTARKRKSISETKTQVDAALVEWGLAENQEINGAVRLSDLQALIDNLSNVDFVELTALYTKPYARPFGTTTNNLIWTNQTKQPSSATILWRLEYDGTNMRVFRAGVFLGNIAIGATYNAPDNIFTFTVSAGSYTNGDIWEFYTYPFLATIQLVDFTIFKVDSADLQITVNAPSNNPVVEC